MMYVFKQKLDHEIDAHIYHKQITLTFNTIQTNTFISK